MLPPLYTMLIPRVNWTAAF